MTNDKQRLIMQICFPCTGCQKLLVADPEATSRQVQCPTCRALVAVPDPRQAVPAAPVPAPREAAPAEARPDAPRGEAAPKARFKGVGEGAGLVKDGTSDDGPVLDVELEEIEDEESVLHEKVVVKLAPRPAPEPTRAPEPDAPEEDAAEPILIEDPPEEAGAIAEPVSVEFL